MFSLNYAVIFVQYVISKQTTHVNIHCVQEKVGIQTCGSNSVKT